MSVSDIVDLCSDEEDAKIDIKPVINRVGPEIKPIIQSDLFSSTIKHGLSKADNIPPKKIETYVRREKTKEDGRSNNSRIAQSSSRTSDQESSVVDGSSPTSTSTLCSAPVIRQFWKAGYYDADQASKIVFPNGKNHLRVHPKFLHSNATSHKWAFGAIAELLDNAIDEIQNGATFVIVDKISNSRDGSAALLIQDDGGGMDPECIRRCMSFGFSENKSKSSIGQYGNGFKTSTMRLGADAIVFSRCLSNRTLTQSVGLLSYTFLRQTGRDDIVVPMVDYEFDSLNSKFKHLLRPNEEHFASNLSILLRWSPYATETELLKQFDDIGHHGTKVIVFNLWLNDDGEMELDFESDEEDIMISGAPKLLETNSVQKMVNQQHIANRFRYSLRVYSSILYMRIPENFRIILCGRVVEQHNIGRDLKFPEFILYKPQVGGIMEVSVITTIGFLKEAPHVNIHGFNVYHKNRLILPFWRVVNQCNSRGRGVVGVLEANFIEPTHDKQDFEKTPLFQKLESRLKHMTLEYWDFHCGLIGYHQVKKNIPAQPVLTKGGLQPVVVSRNFPATAPKASPVGGFSPDQGSTSSHFSAGRPVVTALTAQNSPTTADTLAHSVQGELLGKYPPGFRSEFPVKRKRQSHIEEPDSMERQVINVANVTETRYNGATQGETSTQNLPQNAESRLLIQVNLKFRTQCTEFEKQEEELERKVKQLEMELTEVNREYAMLLEESQLMDRIKVEELQIGR
ncbi:hypothetical protein MRB53_031596 [Persea americana]|uniref:Uncharacterized protein n=1 Tax=Persea americana TaxID=3435 RepID=A0ACC2KPJ6_PERAE|nr:hypothetical protein MRB53_031596 [Persea americana]